MAVLSTTNLALPAHMVESVFKQAQYGSTVQQLSTQTPMLYGVSTSMTFSNPKAEFVGEGSPKSSSGTTPSTVTINPYKAQVTMRFNEEVQWADEDYQLGVLQQLSDKTGPALARALDLGIYFGINPLTGTAFAPITKYINQTTKRIERVATDKPMANLDAAEALVTGIPTGVALDPSFAKSFRGQRDTNGRRIYPDLKLETAASDLDGYKVSVSDTVSAPEAATAPKTLAFVGDYNQIVWGIQRRIGVEKILYGDPDGQGDLKRNNQIALRAEVVYGWVIGDLNAFAAVEDKVAG